MWPSWKSRCADCIVRCVENPSFRLASCVSVDVVNGAAGRSTPGFASTFVTVLGRELRLEIGITRRAKREALLLAIDDEPDGDALHAAGAQTGLDLFPQDRRKRVAVEPIQNAAALLRADQIVV